jgi:hypothetical protein
MSERKVLTEEDYLRLHLQNIENDVVIQEPQTVQTQPTSFDTYRTNDLEYFAFDIEELPCSIFYPKGTMMQIRAARVKEIQSYSMVDDNNPYDVIEKMNDILSSCVKIKYPDGKIGSYKDLKDPDRYYVIFLIRELTFQRGTTLSTNVTCSCGKEVSIELVRAHFKKYEINESLIPYYDQRTGSFRFELTNGKMFFLTPPTIGIQKAFTDFIIRENIQKRKPNLSFLKIVPFILTGRQTITLDEISTELEKFEMIDDVSFQFLNAAVEKMTFGIEKLVKFCQCGLESHTRMTFPNGPSAIFIVHDAFNQFIKK